jgi:predicted dehydrogenase
VDSLEDGIADGVEGAKMDPVKIGIIGVGQIGKMHLGGYAKIPDAQIVAASDVNEAELRRVGEEHHIPHLYTNFREMLERDDLQAVDVCLHNNFHAPMSIAAMRAGKHVYCEKPMAGAYVDAQAMLQTSKDTGKMLHIQMFSVYTRETKAAKRLIAEGKLGKLYHARSTGYRRRGRPYVDGYGTASFVQKGVAAGGALYDMGVYHIAQILYLLGLPEVERISGKTYQETGMDELRRASSGFDVEELGVGFVKLADGLTLDIIEAWAIHLDPFEGSCIVGSEGGIRLEPFGYYSTSADMEMAATFDLGSADHRWHSLNPEVSAYDSSQHHWIAALQGKVELLPTAEIALKTMLISEGIYLSDRLNREVTAEEVGSLSVSTAISV